MSSFLDLGVPAELATVLAASGKTEAFAIQRDTLPDSLAGRDLLGRGRTGSGKTIAFALPLVARLAASGHKRRSGLPRGLVLAPTRELATQIAATVAPWPRPSGCASPPCSAVSASVRRSRRCRAASTSSSPAPAVWKTS